MYWFFDAWNAGDAVQRVLLATIACSSTILIATVLHAFGSVMLRKYRKQQARELIVSMFERYNYGQGRPQGDDFRQLKKAYAFLIRTWIQQREAFSPFVTQDQIQQWLQSMDFEWKKGENPYAQQ